MVLNFEYSLNDIDGKIAYEAFAHTNSSPHELARKIKEEYVKDMSELLNSVVNLVTENNISDIENDLNECKSKYLSLTHTWLRAHGSCYSTFIAGRSKFNHSQAKRRDNAESRASKALSEWWGKAKGSLIKKYTPFQEPLKPSQNDIASKLAKLQKDRKFMQSFNRIVLNKELSIDEKLKKVLALGHITQESAIRAVNENFRFLLIDLDENASKIKKLKKTLESFV